MLNVLLGVRGRLLHRGCIAQSQGRDQAMDLFQQLWPAVPPAISLLIMAALISGIVSWWRRRVQTADQANGN